MQNGFGSHASLADREIIQRGLVAYAVHHWAWIAAFSLAFFSHFTVKALGTITVSEPIAAVLLPLMVSHKIARRESWFVHLDHARLTAVLIALVTSIIGYLLSDFYWGSPLLMSMKGIARIAVFLVNAVVLWMLLDQEKTGWIAYLSGIIAGRVLLTLLFTPLFNDYWKFGFGTPVTFACLLLCAVLGKRYLFQTNVLLLALVAANVVLGSRAASLSVLAFAAQRPFAYHKGFRYVGILSLVMVGGLAMVISLNSFSVRQNTSRSDIERATHIRFCLDGIAKHPFIGNGTWYAASGYVEHYHEVLYRESSFGTTGGFEFGGPLDISIHAQLLNGWCEGGVLGGAFFFVCLGLVSYDLMFRSVDPGHSAHEIRDSFMIQCIFALAFSPFSGLSRWPLAFQLWFVLDRRARTGAKVNSGLPTDTPKSNSVLPRRLGIR